MKSRSMFVLAAVLSTLMFAACKKPPEPAQPPTAPEPQSQADNAPGTTTNFENPTPPPAEPPKQ
jgi:hypothetical protein